MRISGSDAIIVIDNEVWYCIDGLPNRNLAKECDCMKKKFFVVIAIIVVIGNIL